MGKLVNIHLPLFYRESVSHKKPSGKAYRAHCVALFQAPDIFMVLKQPSAHKEAPCLPPLQVLISPIISAMPFVQFKPMQNPTTK